MAKEALEGDIASLDVQIDEELDLFNIEDEIETLSETLGKLEILRKDYVAKTVTLSKLDGGYDLKATDATKARLAAAIKQIKTKKKEVLKDSKAASIKASEDQKKIEDEERKRVEDERIAAQENERQAREKEKEESAKKARVELQVKKINLLEKYKLIHESQKMLYNEYYVTANNVSDEEVLRRKGEMNSMSERFGKIEATTTKCLDDLDASLYFDTELKNANDELMRDINLLRGAKQAFESFVREAVTDRDLSGAKKEGATEIKLEKFSGGEKGLDFYSFKT